MTKAKRRRSYGTGSISKLASGRYLARIWISGQRRQLSHDTHQEARDWLERQASERASLERHGVSRPNVTLAELRDEWIEEAKAAGRTKKTLAGYGSSIDAVLEEYGDTRAAEITPGALREMLAEWREKGWAAATQRNRLSALTSMLRYAMRCDYIPARELPVRRPPIDLHSRPEALTVTQCDALLRAARGQSPRHELAVRLGLDAGLRLGEAFRAKAEDVRDRTLRVPRGKNHRPRTIPIPAPLVAAVEAVDPLAGGYLLRQPGWNSEGVFIRWLTPAWPANLPYHFHRLRHTWASRLANGPDPATPWELMTWGGWRTMIMVTRYYHSPETIRRGPVDAMYPDE